jgi:hypothetical protein
VVRQRAVPPRDLLHRIGRITLKKNNFQLIFVMKIWELKENHNCVKNLMDEICIS